MDCSKIGQLIRRLRTEQHMTQLQLAARLHVSDKAVSKWERGAGCPDVSLLPLLSDSLGVPLDDLLSGEVDANDATGGNMKKLKFYLCPQCGNLITSTADAAVSCCGKKLQPTAPRKAEPSERLTVEQVENDYFISSDHEMSKEHYISFVALLTGDTLVLKKQYPEWDLQVRIPRIGHGMLVWHCVRHGLMYQLV